MEPNVPKAISLMWGNAAFYSLILFCTGITIGKEIKVKLSFRWDKPNPYLILNLAFQLFHNKRQTCSHIWSGFCKCDVNVYSESTLLSEIWPVKIFIRSLLHALKGYIPKFHPICTKTELKNIIKKRMLNFENKLE